MREICNTYKDIQTVNAIEQTKRTAIREQARCAMEGLRQETARYRYKIDHLHEERMEMIDVFRTLIEKDVIPMEFAEKILDGILRDY